MALKVTNNAVSTLASGITDVATSLTLASGDGNLKFPSLSAGDYFHAKVKNAAGDFEIIKATARSGDVLTIERGQQGTTAVAWLAGDAIFLTITADDFNLALNAMTSADLQNATPIIWADAGGSADAITASYTPSITALSNAMRLGVRAAAANDTKTPTFSPDGQTARTITRDNGQPLFKGDIAGDGHDLILSYDGDNSRWLLLNPATPSQTTTDSGASPGPTRTRHRNSPSPAADDYLGEDKEDGENDADEQVTYARRATRILSAADGQEAGTVELFEMRAGSEASLGYQVGGRLLVGEDVLCPHEGLTVKNNAANSNFQMDIDAAALLLRDSNRNVALAESVDLTVDITASGANGLDTGSETSNTWYYLWVIYNPSTGTVAGLISLSATAPSLPSGFTYKGLVGAVRNNGSSDFGNVSQVGPSVSSGSFSVINAGNNLSITQVDISSAIPSIAKRVSGWGSAKKGGAGIGSTWILVASDSNETSQQLMGGMSENNVAGGYAPFDIAVVIPQTFYYRVNASGRDGDVRVTGWRY